jgi:hypothetical protein
VWGSEQGDCLEFGLSTMTMVGVIVGRGTRDGRCEGMNQHTGSVDSMACAGDTKV